MSSLTTTLPALDDDYQLSHEQTRDIDHPDGKRVPEPYNKPLDVNLHNNLPVLKGGDRTESIAVLFSMI